MLRPITSWDDLIELRSVLAERSQQIFLCEDCQHPWISRGKQPPERCPQCKALADSPKRNRPGRPVLS